MYYVRVMLVSHFDRLRRKKALEEDRDITLGEIADKSGVALTTIHKIRRGDIEKVHASTLAALCRYFAVKSIAELVEYVPDAPATERD